MAACGKLLNETPASVVGRARTQLSLARDVACGLAYLHAQQPKPVLHRDIKSGNVLLFAKGHGVLAAKVADFGLATTLDGTSSASSKRASADGLTGTYAYMSPEAWRNQYQPKSDVYSFGILLWELLTGKKPWQRDGLGRSITSPGVIMALVTKGERPPLEGSDGPPQLNALAKRCWAKSAHARPTFDQVHSRLLLVLEQLTQDAPLSGNQSTAEPINGVSPFTASYNPNAEIATPSVNLAAISVAAARSTFVALFARVSVHPFFYIVLSALLVAKAATVAIGLSGDMQQPRTRNVAVGTRMGLLPYDEVGGFPAPLTLDGSICLALPLQYDFTTDARQRSNIPVVYGLMHAALLCLLLMPLPLCHSLWTSLVACAPSLRRWVPIDDFEYVHRLLGVLCIGLVALGAVVWLGIMVPACAAGGDACLAFARGGLDGSQFDPFRNVLILRLIIAPLWGTVLPLMMVAGTSWQSFEAVVRAQTGLARLLICHVRNPVVIWLWFVGVAIGLAGGTWAGGKIGALVGTIIGAVGGVALATSPTIRLHWYEFVYWLHRAVAYMTIVLALIARFDIFWPCAATWLLFALDKLVQARKTQTLFIDALQSRCIEDSRGQPSKLRLVLRVRNTGGSAFTRHAASRWVYLSVPEMFSSASSRLTHVVGRAWHPLSLAAQSDSKIELLIDVHPRLSGRLSWSEQLFAHVSRLQESAVDTTASRATYAAPLQVRVRGPFGSAFARCFEMVRRPDQPDAPRHNIVVLFGSGIGLPSALSALHEFVRRRRAGVAVPRFVWFLWQCRSTEELKLCWDSLHRIIYGAKGMCDEHAWKMEQQALVRGQRIPLDYGRHQKRNARFRPGDAVRFEGSQAVHVKSGHSVSRSDTGCTHEPAVFVLPSNLRARVGEEITIGGGTFCNVGLPWDTVMPSSPSHPPEQALLPPTEELPPMLDWLGVTLHVSSWKRDAQQEAEGRATLLCDNPLQVEDPTAERVHRWLHSRLRAGYHDLSTLLGELDNLDHEYVPHQAEPRRLCVSMCGSQRALLQTRRHVAEAKGKLRGRADLSFELAADYHG